MKKILLIEDREKRQQLFIQEHNLDFSNYEDILINAVNEKYIEVSNQLKEDKFDFNKYSMIITHKSAFENDNSEIIEKLKQGCKITKIPLVFFSGGIDENFYNNSNNYEFVILNSKVFYSKNLEIFLNAYKNHNENILMLLYGEKWEINIALNVLEKLNIFLEIDNEEEIYYDDIADYIDLLKNTSFKFKELKVNEYDEVNREEVINFKNQIYKYIEESVIYE